MESINIQDLFILCKKEQYKPLCLVINPMYTKKKDEPQIVKDINFRIQTACVLNGKDLDVYNYKFTYIQPQNLKDYFIFDSKGLKKICSRIKLEYLEDYRNRWIFELDKKHKLILNMNKYYYIEEEERINTSIEYNNLSVKTKILLGKTLSLCIS
jgi:hypothetical protein